MPSPLRHRLLNQLACLVLLLPGFLFSQVIIREKVEIKPQPPLRSTHAALSAEIRVESSFDGDVDPDLPQLIWLKGPCGVNSGSGSVSGSLTAPSYEGLYKAGYRFTNPAGGSGGQFRFAVYLGDSLVREFRTTVSCPTGCTLLDEWTIQVFAGFTFLPQYALIGSGATNTFGAVESTSTVPCSPGAWIADWAIELEITKGKYVGSFVDGGKRSYTVVKKKSQFSTFSFLADGEKGYGDVEITARSAGITVVKGFKVIAPAPRVKIVPPWWWYGQPIKLAFDNLPALEFTETHSPGAGQKFEPVITWEPDDTINTANYFNLVDELYVKVRAENAGGVARDSVKLVFQTECIKVNFDPEELSPSDTAKLSFQRVKEDGTLEDLPRGLYTFSVMVVGGEDSSKGWFVTEEEEPEGGTTLLDASAPILYIAPASIPDTLMSVQVLASAWELIWWKRDEVKGGAPGIQNLSVKQAEVEQAEVEQAGTKLAGAKADFANRISTASLGAALSSDWCPISQVVVKGSPLHHFLVTVQPDTIDHGDASTIKAQAKDQNNGDIEPLAGTKVDVSLNSYEKHGNLTYEELRGLEIPDVPYTNANEGKVKFIADGENPIGKPPQPVPIGVTSDGKEGTAQVVVRCKVQPPRYSQGGRGTNRAAWADSIYDNSGKNIATLGCALSTMAMAMTAYGDTVNPGQLNSWKKQAPQDSGGYRGESTNWNAITKHSNGEITLSYSKARFWKDSLRTAVDSTQMTDPSILESNLDVCKLVIVQVYNNETGNQHWVLVTRKLNGRYTIVDPGGRNEQFLDAYGSFWSYLIVSKN